MFLKLQLRPLLPRLFCLLWAHHSFHPTPSQQLWLRQLGICCWISFQHYNPAILSRSALPPPLCWFPTLVDMLRLQHHHLHHWLRQEFLAWHRVQVGFRCLLLFPHSCHYWPLHHRALSASWLLQCLHCSPLVGPCPKLMLIRLCPFPTWKKL